MREDTPIPIEAPEHRDSLAEDDLAHVPGWLVRGSQLAWAGLVFGLVVHLLGGWRSGDAAPGWQLVALAPLLGVALGLRAMSRRVGRELRDYAETFERAARTDVLTGLWNRRHLDRQLEAEWLRARRDGKSLALILCDVDHFKQVNDRFGHVAGDHCLVRVAGHLRTQVRRPADLVCRWGGEEFAILLPDSDEEGAAVLAERICFTLPDAVRTDDGKPVTASLGVAACVPSSEIVSASLFSEADRSLYAAKTSGRSCVVRSSERDEIG